MASLRSALPIAILLSIRHISLRSCHSSWSVHESSVAVQKTAYLDNHLLCRIVVHSCRMQLLTAQFSPIVNTEPEEHATEVPKQELPGTIGDSPFGACKEHVRQPRDSDVVLSSTVPPCRTIAISGITMCLSGPWEGYSTWRPKTLTGVWAFCFYAVHGARRCAIPSSFPLERAGRQHRTPVFSPL
jgi:hypothetical protein